MNINKASGFTLIELLIVVAIVGILSAVATAYYGSYVLAANRTDARSSLSEISTSLEKCKSLYSRYDSPSCNVIFPVTSGDGFYDIVATVITQTTFTLTASPVAGKAQANDAKCTSLTLTNTGIEGGTGTDPDECW